MDYQAAEKHLLEKPEAIKDYPFGPDVAVFKVRHKMFATLGVAGSDENALKALGVKAGTATMNLKCDPDQALALRDIFPAVIPGYHMNKRHWNTVILDDSIPSGEVARMIDHSYGLVVNGLPIAERQALELRYGREKLYVE